jgi:hypothetical protein
MATRSACAWILVVCQPLPYFLAGCDGDATVTFCFTSTHCNFDLDVGTQSCTDTLECPHSHPHPHQMRGIESASATPPVDFETTLFDAGGGRVDIELQAFGDEVGGSSPVSVRWLGPGISELPFQARRDLWRFHGLPEAAVDEIEVSIPGSDFRARKGLEAPRIEGRASCDPRQSLILFPALPDIPGELEVGVVLEFRAPRTVEALASGRARGLAIEAFPPGGEPRTSMIPEGGWGEVLIERPGRWFFRAILLAEDVCGPDTAELIVIQEAEVSAR